jgi:hypothetical protein
MKRFPLFKDLLILGVAAITALPYAAEACAVCFGASDSPLAKGMNAGILTLLAVVVFVLGGIAAFGCYLVRRAAIVSSTSVSKSASNPDLELTDKP